MMNTVLLTLIPAISLISGLIIFLLKNNQATLRNTLNLLAASSKVMLVLYVIYKVSLGGKFQFTYQIYDTISLRLFADPLSLLFVGLSSLLWFLTTIYAIGYFGNSQNLSRFFGFFNLCVTCTVGIALAGNLFTFLLFYELLTLTTYPLVTHKGDAASLESGKTYLIYTMCGGTLLFLALLWLRSIVGPVNFIQGGGLNGVPFSPVLGIIFILMIIGFGVKAALVPLHSWLPRAMTAPAPVSSLLHAVAVVKAGAFGIVRTIYDIYGVTILNSTKLLIPVSIIAAITIIYGSIMALLQTDLKKRLAFSTVSQVSYITLGASIFGPLVTLGAVVHIVHQGIMKITLFFCAGAFAEVLGKKKISELDGVGRQMPATAFAFSIAAAGMIGIPPTAGFISKWYLGIGAGYSGAWWVIGIFIASSFLNAAYFLPIIYRLWFASNDESHTPSRSQNWMLIAPAIITALLTIFIGLFPNLDFSPASWAKRIVEKEYS